MRIGLIAMSGVRVKSAELAALGITLPGFIRRGKVIASLPSLGLLTVAALTPPDHEVALLEIDRLEPSSRLPEFDLVGISSLTANIDEAYKVADHFRQRGSRVVMGGLHVSQLPEEALVHADAVVINGAEWAWPQIIRDVESHHLRRIYHGANDNVFSNGCYIRPRFDLLRGRAYNRVTVQTSRGCPRDCEFCGASLRITRRFNQKPVELVIEEIRESRRYIDQPFFEFADDNTFINKEWSKNLLKQLAGEQIHYFTETDVSIADDLELCDLLAESGCKQVLIGFESPDASDLSGLDPRGWKMKQADRYKRAIEILQGRGVSVNGCFILGLDNYSRDFSESSPIRARSRAGRGSIHGPHTLSRNPALHPDETRGPIAGGTFLGCLHSLRCELQAAAHDRPAASRGLALALPGNVQPHGDKQETPGLYPPIERFERNTIRADLNVSGFAAFAKAEATDGGGVMAGRNCRHESVIDRRGSGDVSRGVRGE